MAKLIYIGGYGRSGSTLLEYVLTVHQSVVACGEVERHLRSSHRKRTCTCRRHMQDCPVWHPFQSKSGRRMGWSHEELTVRDGVAHRADQANKEDAGLLRDACESYLAARYEPLPEPIGKEVGDHYAKLVGNFIEWHKDLPCSAIPTDPVFLAQFLHERREAGDSQDEIGLYADAIARANGVVGWADPTSFQLTLSVISNLKKGQN